MTAPVCRDEFGAAPPADTDAVGRTYTSPQVVALAGISFRQLDYWCRAGLLDGAARDVDHWERSDRSPGSGRRRDFTFADVELLQAAAALLREGFTAQAAFRIGRLLTTESGGYEAQLTPVLRLSVVVTPAEPDGVES